MTEMTETVGTVEKSATSAHGTTNGIGIATGEITGSEMVEGGITATTTGAGTTTADLPEGGKTMEGMPNLWEDTGIGRPVRRGAKRINLLLSP